MSMWLRLNLALGIIVATMLLGMMLAMIIDARPRLTQESESVAALTAQLVRASSASLQSDDKPEERLAELVRALASLRHVRVTLEQPVAAAMPLGRADMDDAGWWRLAVTEDVAPVRVPVVVSGRTINTVVITPDPSDELAELKDAAYRIAQYGLVMGLLAFLVTTRMVHRTLQPLSALTAAMQRMQDGRFDVDIPSAATPEIQSVSVRLKELASALLRSRAENQRLSARMISVQDDERRDIARELHDELGPHLFSLRAAEAAMQRELQKEAPDLHVLQTKVADAAAHVDALQKTNRRVLNRLNPMGLRELGLPGALQAMAALWMKQRPEVVTRVVVGPNCEALGDPMQLTVFRIVQEGLTNAHKHADARVISAEVRRSAAHDGGEEQLSVEVVDDGKGTAEEHQPGMGLLGIEERVAALGGFVKLRAADTGGLRLEVRLPLRVLAYGPG